MARAAAVVLAGAGTAAAAVATVSVTALRHNRFLAAGLTALAAAAVGILGAILAPALARLCRHGAGDRRPFRALRRRRSRCWARRCWGWPAR